MLARVRAAQATVDAFRDKPLKWGQTDCGRLAGFVLREMGHSPRLARFGRYSSPAGALKALRGQKFNDLPDVLDAMGLDRIPPAMALPGDILGVPGEGMTALAVVLGNNNAIAFAEDQVCRIGKIKVFDGVSAWRVPCLKL